jgi:hypothetical protein
LDFCDAVPRSSTRHETRGTPVDSEDPVPRNTRDLGGRYVITEHRSHGAPCYLARQQKQCGGAACEALLTHWVRLGIGWFPSGSGGAASTLASLTSHCQSYCRISRGACGLRAWWYMTFCPYSTTVTRTSGPPVLCRPRARGAWHSSNFAHRELATKQHPKRHTVASQEEPF